MPSTIFSGSKVKALKSTLSLNGGADIISSTTNPQTSAVSAEPGSLLLNTTSGTMYRKLDSGSSTNWVEVGSGGGGKNYIKNPDFDGGATTNWSMQKVSLSSLIPTGNIGAADAGHTISASSSSPLEGANSLLVDGASAFTAGNCLVSKEFAIDREDMAKVMGWSFYYEAITTNMDFSGTSSNTWAVYIAEVTTATPDTVVSWIQPAGVYNLVQGSGVGLASGTFQTTATGTAYRLVLVCINSEAAATTLKVDDFQLGPQQTVQGAPVTDWVSYTPTLAGVGTATNVNFKYRRVGDTIQVTGAFQTGTPTAVQFTVSLPYGTIDSTKINTNATIGNLTRSTTLNQAASVLARTDLSSSVVYVGGEYQNSPQLGLTPQNGSTLFAASEGVALEFFYPAAGLSSNTVMSQDTDTRVVAARYEVSGARSGALSGAVVNYDTKIIDTHSAVTTGASWSFRAPISGIYRVTGQIEGNSSGAGLLVSQIRKNGTVLSSGTFPVNSATNYCAPQAEAIVSCNAGDLIDIYESPTTGSWTKGGIPATNYVNIERLSGPSTIAASEMVSCVYSSNTATVIGTTATTIPFEDKDFDTHGFYNPSTGIATIPVSGKYLVVCGTYYNSSAQGYSFAAVQGGSVSKTYRLGEKTTSTSTGYQIVGSAEFNCLAGDTLRIQATASAGGVGLFPLNELNHLSIIRVGN